MEFRFEDLRSSRSDKVEIKIMKGHFATEHTHVNTYIDISTLTGRYRNAREAARLLVERYQLTTRINTIVCLDGTKLIGAFMAEILAGSGMGNPNSGENIAVITPEIINRRQMVFRDNTKDMIAGQNVLIIAGSITTGENVLQATSSVIYYKGKVVGICAVFSHVHKVAGMEIQTIFSGKDLPEYKSYHLTACPLCERGRKIDALVNSYGYSLL